MGACVGQPDKSRERAPSSIIELVRKIKLMSEQQQLKKKQMLQEQELILIENFGKEAKQRASSMETAIINRTVFSKNLVTIYTIIQMEAKKILDYKDTMQQNLDAVTSSIQILIYSASILREELLFQLEAKVKAIYPDFRYPLDQDIRHDILRHHKKTEQVNFQMENEYIMDFSNQYNIEVSRICEGGHKYGYAASLKH